MDIFNIIIACTKDGRRNKYGGKCPPYSTPFKPRPQSPTATTLRLSVPMPSVLFAPTIAMLPPSRGSATPLFLSLSLCLTHTTMTQNSLFPPHEGSSE